MPKISIAIPTYEYRGHGVEVLDYSFRKMAFQTFKDFEVVVSDHSVDDEIERLCDRWRSDLHIRYFRNKNDRGNGAANLNNAINYCDGRWIKILCQDDYLMDEDALEITSNALDHTENWLATGYLHSHDRKNFENYHYPFFQQNILIQNTIGTPSCVTIRNVPDLLHFDTNLSYYYDCEYYYRLFLKDGEPTLISDVTIVNYLWDKSVTAGVTMELVEREVNYILKKHNKAY